MTREQAVKFLLSHPAEFGHLLGFTKLEQLHNEWIVDMLRGTEDTTLQAHRESYKTTCVSIALALTILLTPTKRSMFMRKTDSDVKEIVKQVQKILESPQTQVFCRAIYGVPLRMTTATATEINTNLAQDNRGTSQLLGIGLGSSLTGKHFDRIFTDDIVNLQDRISKAERDRTKLIYQELQNIKQRGGRIYNTGTPWHKDDCFAIMPKPKVYDCYSTGLMTQDEIETKKARMERSLFAANYELRHVASDDVIFTEPKTGEDSANAEQGICHIDASYGGSDSTAFTICRKLAGKYYVFGKLWQKHVDDCIPEIIELRKRFNAGMIYCENNGDKGYLAKDLRKRGERVTVYHEDMNKYIKITSYLKSEWENVIFVEGTDESYINQICDYNENAEHDDAPDSLSCIVRKLWRKNSYGEKPQLIW